MERKRTNEQELKLKKERVAQENEDLALAGSAGIVSGEKIDHWIQHAVGFAVHHTALSFNHGYVNSCS